MTTPNTSPARQILRVAMEAAYTAAKKENKRLTGTYNNFTELELKEMRQTLMAIAETAWNCA